MSTSAETELAEANTAAARDFFTSPYFAVTGASPNEERFGYKSLCTMSSINDHS